MTDSTCVACSAPIRWVVTEGGKRMPLDLLPVADGNVVPVVVDGHVRARVLAGSDLPAQGQAWQSHFRSCPAAPEFRARKGRTAPRCRVCELPMDADLARSEGWTTHPCCDPAEGAAAARAVLAAAASPPPDEQLDLT